MAGGDDAAVAIARRKHRIAQWIPLLSVLPPVGAGLGGRTVPLLRRPMKGGPAKGGAAGKRAPNPSAVKPGGGSSRPSVPDFPHVRPPREQGAGMRVAIRAGLCEPRSKIGRRRFRRNLRRNRSRRTQLQPDPTLHSTLGTGLLPSIPESAAIRCARQPQTHADEPAQNRLSDVRDRRLHPQVGNRKRSSLCESRVSRAGFTRRRSKRRSRSLPADPRHAFLLSEPRCWCSLSRLSEGVHGIFS